MARVKRLFPVALSVASLAEALDVDRRVAPIPGLERPILVHVDYVNHRIERLTLEEHAVRLDAAGVRA